MSTLQIKPRNDTDQLKIQTSGGNTAFFVHGSGATLKNSTIENNTIENTNTFHAGHIIQTQYNSIDVENNIIVNNTTIYGTLDLEFNRIKSNSYFLITISALAYRPATNGQANLGYRISVNGSVIQSKALMVKDDNSWTQVSRIYKDTTTGSVNDTVKIESVYQNTYANDNIFRVPFLLVQEISAG